MNYKRKNMKETIVLNDALCEHIADLAKLNISKTEKEAIFKDMNDIVEFVSKLNETSNDFENPTISTFPRASMREDIPKKSLPREKILAASSSLHDGYITVPKVIEG